jgi:glycine/D-amino acid oxidase-like deaminating enzyme
MTDWGAPVWRIEPTPAAGPLPAHVDVAVVGAGFTGLSTAWHLARRGARVAVLEASRIGAGASGRTGGLVLEGTAAGPLPGANACLETLREVVTEADIDCDLRLGGCWELVHARTPGARRALWPDGGTMLCIDGTEAGGTVDPGALVGGLARAAVSAGATLHEHTAVARVERDGVVLAHRTLSADHVILAVNAYTPALGALPVRMTPALTLALATAPLDDAALAALGLDPRMPFYTTDLPYLWGRVTADGRLVVGAGLTFAANDVVTSVGLEDPETAASLARLEGRVRELHPTLAAVEITHRWGGPIAFLADRIPLLGRHPDLPHVIVTAAYSGHGVALGVQIGALIAAAIVDGRALPPWGSLQRCG